MVALVLLAVLALVPPIVLVTSPMHRRLALRNAVRRPREALLVIVGSMLATALITASFVIGDSFRASIRSNVHTQLGPVDEIVGVPLAQRTQLDPLLTATIPGTDGVEPLVRSAATAAVLRADGTAEASAPVAQLLELDFARARNFGGDPRATGVTGPTPTGNQVVITAPLAAKLGVRIGAHITANALGRSLPLTVVRVVPQQGLAGLWLGNDFTTVSYNMFVAPGTIARVAAVGAASAQPPQYIVLVSNRGDVESGAARTAAVTTAITHTLPVGVHAEVSPVKQNALDAADTAGKSLTQLYSTVGSFAVFAGVLLLINIFLMLGEERKSELGMLRAMGMRRRSLIAAFAAEGWIYGVIASVVGAGVGLGVGRLVLVGAARIVNGNDPETRLAFTFHAEPRSILVGLGIGLAIALVTIYATSVVISRFNIIAAIRDTDAPSKRTRSWTSILRGVLAALGAALLVSGVARHDVVPMMIGGALLAVGSTKFLTRVLGHRAAVTITAGGALAWTVASVPLAVGLGGDLPFQGFFVQGIVLVVSAVVLISEYQSELGHLLARVTRNNLSVRLGLAYPLARRQRTALTLAQFSIVVFVLTYISVLTGMFRTQADALAKNLGGSSNAFVKSNPGNPIPIGSVAQQPGVRAVVPLTFIGADITPPTDTKPTQWFMSGFDRSMLAGTPPKLRDRGRFGSDRAAYDYVLTHPGTAIADEFFLARRAAGPPQAKVHIGDTITVADRFSGRSRRVEIVAMGQNDWLLDGGLTSVDTIRSISPDAVPTRAFVDAVDPAAFSRRAENLWFAQGAQADPLRTLVDKRLTRQTQFFTLIRAFLALGLVIGIAGIGVIMVRAVRERRRQVGVLRALGFPAGRVSNAFAIEAMFVALEGVVVGVLLGLVCTWSVTLSNSFGDSLRFVLPVTPIVVLVLGTLLGALLATLGPARSASRIDPAVALRIND